MGRHEETWGAGRTVHAAGAARRRRGAVLTLGAAALLLGLAWWLREPLHGLPLERDEGAYATIAVRWLAGDALYRDLFDHKPPLVYAVFALAQRLPGGPIHQVRELATLYLLASGLAVLALGWRLYGRVAAGAALALFLAYGSSLRFQGLIFNSEAVLVLPATIGCLLATQSTRAWRATLLALAGVCVGLAIAAKPVGALLLGPLALAALLSSPESARRSWRAGGSKSWAGSAVALAAALGGALLPLLGFALVLHRQGALPAAYQALIVYNRLYAAESLARGWDPTYLWRIWAPMLALALPALAGLALALARRQWRSPAYLVAALWGAALLASALLSLRAYPHYCMAAVPLLSVWGGAGIALLANAAPGGEINSLYDEDTKARRFTRSSYPFFVPARPAGQTTDWIRALAALAALAGLLAIPVAEIWPLRRLTPYEQIGSLYGPEGYGYFGHAGEVASYVARHVPRGEPIFVWAAEPEIYYLAGRRPATRFVYDYPVEQLPGGRDELLEALRAAPPRLIVTYHDVRPMGFHPFMPDHGYELRATIGGYDVYERGD